MRVKLQYGTDRITFVLSFVLRWINLELKTTQLFLDQSVHCRHATPESLLHQLALNAATADDIVADMGIEYVIGSNNDVVLCGENIANFDRHCYITTRYRRRYRAPGP